jgi:putative ABC transport system permease protein
MNTLKLALRFLYRDWKAGELNLLLLALVLCVASITTVGFFVNRVELAMNQQSSELLAADFVIASSKAIDSQRITQARQLGLSVSVVRLFRSVLVAGDAVQLVEVKSVDAQYPLRGNLRLSKQQFVGGEKTRGKPASGEVWVEPRLLQAMALDVGDTIQLGARRFTISRVINYEPDRGGEFFRMAPRLMLNSDDLASTRLMQTGSRFKERLLVAGERQQVERFIRQIKKDRQHGEELISVRDGRPEIRFAYERSEFFLNIIALISVLLGGIATALAALRYSRRHIDTVAILRTGGLTSTRIFLLFLFEMLFFAIIVIAIGCMLGYVGQLGLAEVMANLIVADLPQPDMTPVLVGAITGLVTLLAFVMPPFWLLRKAPPIRVLRRNQVVPVFSFFFVIIFVAAIFVLWVWRLGNENVTQYILFGSLGTIAALYASAWLAVYLMKPLRNLLGISWRYGLANITRRANLSAMQITAFGLGIMFILLNSLIRTELLGTWRNTLPADVPNYFMTNVQQDQIASVQQFFKDRQINKPEFAPMTRGRLVAVNGRTVTAEDFEHPQAKRLLLRDFNLSWNESLRPGNEVLKGRWWQSNEAGKPYISLDAEVAQRFKLKIGDRLSFDIAGTQLEVELLNTRKIDWNSFRVNFFALTPPGLLEEFPANWVSSMHLTPEQAPSLVKLVRQFPNVTLIDIDVIITRIRNLMDRIAAAVEFLLFFTLAVGVIIMLTALRTTQDERRQEAALLRTMGAQRSWIIKGALAEFAMLGVIAGGIAGVAATATGWVLAKEVFKFEYQVTVLPTLLGIVFGVLLISLIGLLGTNKVLRQPPIDTFRSN